MKTSNTLTTLRYSLVLIVVILFSIVLLGGCGNKKQSSAPTSDATSSTLTPATSSIVGSWTIDDSDLTKWSWEGEFSSIIDNVMGDTKEFPHTLTFYKDGTYSFTKGYYWEYRQSGQNGTSYEIKHFPEERFSGTYTIISDGKAIQFSSHSSYVFVQKGNTLKITGENGTVFTYNKVN